MAANQLPNDFPAFTSGMNHGQRTARISRWLYHYREPGFFRVNVCGWRFVIIDTNKRRPIFSDRLHGRRVGRFLFNLSPATFIRIIKVRRRPFDFAKAWGFENGMVRVLSQGEE